MAVFRTPETAIQGIMDHYRRTGGVRLVSSDPGWEPDTIVGELKGTYVCFRGFVCVDRTTGAPFVRRIHELSTTDRVIAQLITDDNDDAWAAKVSDPD